MAGPKITLDTNSILNVADDDHTTATSVDSLQTMINYALSGKAEIAATTRAEADIANDRDLERRKTMLTFLKVFPIVGTIARLNTSRLGGGDVLAGDVHQRLHAEVQAIVFPGLQTDDRRYRNKVYDIDHLVGHKLNGRDIFVTDDRDIWRRREVLAKGPGIVVMRPAECLAYLDEVETRARPKLFPTDGANPAYQSTALRGRVAFDYSNNDHRYALGEGHFYFETRWSKASDRSIRAYNDPASIRAIALVKGAGEIAEIADAASYDFSSRGRCPAIGEIVIWLNDNGLYAATRIVSIKDDSRNDERDELVFDYVILADGGADFGSRDA
jgi:hypothetical protein